eukprot:g5963.t1
MASPTLHVRVVEARNLKNTQTFGKQDPYVHLRFRGQECRTKTHQDGGRQATFGDKFSFQVVDLGSDTLTITVKNDNMMTDAFIGTTTVGIRNMGTGALVDSWFSVASSGGAQTGQVRIRMQLVGLAQPGAPAAPPQAQPMPAAYAAPPPAAPQVVAARGRVALTAALGPTPAVPGMPPQQYYGQPGQPQVQYVAMPQGGQPQVQYVQQPQYVQQQQRPPQYMQQQQQVRYAQQPQQGGRGGGGGMSTGMAVAGGVAVGAAGMYAVQSGALDGVGDAMGSAAGAVGDAAGAAWDGAGDAAGAVGDFAGDAAGAAWDGAGDVGGAVWDGAGDAAEAVGDFAGDAASAIGDFFS